MRHLIGSFALAVPALAFGQTSDTTTGPTTQVQAGAVNLQDLSQGNAQGNARAKARTGSGVQVQVGALNRQSQAVGNASGHGRSDAAVGTSVQVQAGVLNRQQLAVGNAAGGSATTRVDKAVKVQAEIGRASCRERV